MLYTDGSFTHFPLAGVSGAVDLSALYQDRDDSLWVGTFKHGIARLRDGRLQIDRALSAQIKDRVDVIHRDRAGNLWFGGRTGLYRLDDAGRVTNYSPKDGLASGHVKTLVEDAAGRLWVGGYGGVSLWQNGGFKTWTTSDGLSSDSVLTLYEDREQTIWVGTYDGGLYRLRKEPAGWKLTRYTTREGLFTNEVKQILEDEQGFFWIGSSRGIYRLRKQELNDFANGRVAAVSSTHFGSADGLENSDIIGGFQPAGFKARDGRLWFPTQVGIAVLDPRRIPFNPKPPPVVIEDCLLDRQPTPFRQGAEASGFRFDSDITPLNGVFSTESEINFYRIMQESLNNIVKHSDASEAQIRIGHDARRIELLIRDNGKGFESNASQASGSGRAGFGLTSIAERARILGGKHSIKSVPGRGTTVTVRIGSSHDE